VSNERVIYERGRYRGEIEVADCFWNRWVKVDNVKFSERDGRIEVLFFKGDVDAPGGVTPSRGTA
jgi:hypothetical protein